ncbi:helix-turn-helix transcriptional regulator [Cellulosimicrobium sp. CpK407]|uniref:helix-turn-helix transcriptional regulator n=1 Tax=Cellulosimicrobium sp. CpK407 TaxID=3229847 RepID=UPI003F2FE806
MAGRVSSESAVLTQSEVASMLRVPEATLQDLARRGDRRIPPAFKVGRAWRWLADDVHAFVESRGQVTRA